MAKHRKAARASSRAHTTCPHCNRRQHGERGLKAHIAAMHVAPKETGHA